MRSIRLIAVVLGVALLLYPTGASAQYRRSGFYVDSSVRFQVSPKAAEIYVDGYYAGTVDDFDGAFQRLRLEPGGHEFVLWAPGFRSVSTKVLLQPNQTFRMKQAMEPLRAGEAQDPKPTAPPRPTPPSRP